MNSHVTRSLTRDLRNAYPHASDCWIDAAASELAPRTWCIAAEVGLTPEGVHLARLLAPLLLPFVMVPHGS